MTMAMRSIGIVAAALALSACGLFGGDDDEKDLEPTKLTDIKTTVQVKRLWSANVGADSESGKEFWRSKLEIELSSGPGVGEGLVVVGAGDGDLIALNADSGDELWRVNVGGESLATPLIKDDLVIAITIDNRLRGLSAFDGSERWIVEQSTPRLTMRGSASPVLAGTSVIGGFDNGRLLAVNLSTGDIEWETMLSPPTGRSDLERLADIDGMISVVGPDVYAAGYQGDIAAIASESGQILWSRDVSSFEGVSADWNNVYTVDAEGAVIALTRRSGDETWRQTSLLRREPTVPIAFQTTVVVGDLEGYLHFFSNFDGNPVARVKVGGQAISNEPIVVADRLYVQSDAGTVSAFVVQEPKRKRNAPDISDEGA